MDEEKYARKIADWEEKAARRSARWEEKAARWESKWEGRSKRRACRSGGGGLVVGGIIVVVGLMLLLDNMGILRAHDMWRYWPLALVAVGLSRILESHRPAALVWGGMLAAVGVLLFLDNLGILLFDFHMLWPLIIIAFGVSMFVRAMDRGRLAAPPGEEPVDSNPTLSLFAIFGGTRRQIRTADFRGGEAFALFGGFHLDLRGAQMPSGRAVFDVNAIFGGCEIHIPDGWHLNVQATGIFGGVDDKTIPPRPVEGVQIPELVLTGMALFGGIGIRN